MSLLEDVNNLAAGFGKGSSNKSAPISLYFKSAQGLPIGTSGPLTQAATANASAPTLAAATGNLLTAGPKIKLFTSYSFERNMLSPGAPFRFTAPGVDKATRLQIRSGDTVQLIATDPSGAPQPVGTGFIDETDTHISPHSLEYVLTGRDTLGQLIDNTAVDKNNVILYIQQAPLGLPMILQTLINNTRIPQTPINQNMPNGSLLFQTNPGETKMNALQRYLEFTNCLVWTAPNGQVICGKPNTTALTAFNKMPTLVAGLTGAPSVTFPSLGKNAPQTTNVLDVRIRRNTNLAIRRIIVQLQDFNGADAGNYNINNQDQDVQNVAGSGAGRSVYDTFSYGEGANTANFLTAVGNGNGDPKNLGAAIAQRTLARENVKVLEVEVTVQGHFDSNGSLFNVDTVYYCQFPDDNVNDQMYCYSVTHDLTLEHGMTTKLRLCKLAGTLVAGVYSTPVASLPVGIPRIL